MRRFDEVLTFEAAGKVGHQRYAHHDQDDFSLAWEARVQHLKPREEKPWFVLRVAHESSSSFMVSTNGYAEDYDSWERIGKR